MTLSFLRNEIWQMIGEPSDIDPSTDTQYNGGPLLDFVVNEGLREVATFKDPSSDRAVRLPEFLGEMFFQSYYLSGTLDADAPSSTTLVFPAADNPSSTDDAYNGWVVTIGGEDRLIVDYVGATTTATLSTAWVTEPDSGDTYELSKSFSYVVASGDDSASYHIITPTSGAYHRGNFLIPLKLTDIANNRGLAKASKIEGYDATLRSTGTPTEWLWTGNKLTFNFVSDEKLWYKMEYYRLPKTLSADSDAPDIPEFLQYGIVLWGIWWGFRRQMSSPDAYSSKQDFIDFMRQRLNLYSVEFLREDDYGVLRVR